MLPYWPRERFIELAPKSWAATRSTLDADELAAPVGVISVPADGPRRRSSGLERWGPCTGYRCRATGFEKKFARSYYGGFPQVGANAGKVAGALKEPRTASKPRPTETRSQTPGLLLLAEMSTHLVKSRS